MPVVATGAESDKVAKVVGFAVVRYGLDVVNLELPVRAADGAASAVPQ